MVRWKLRRTCCLAKCNLRSQAEIGCQVMLGNKLLVQVFSTFNKLAASPPAIGKSGDLSRNSPYEWFEQTGVEFDGERYLLLSHVEEIRRPT